MIQTSWKDGWIPEKYFPQVMQSILDSIIEASWWAWYEKDHKFLREISRNTSIKDFPLPLKLRILYSRLIAPWIK
jgi:hypothetical protein